MLCLNVEQRHPDLDGCIAATDVSGTAAAFLMPMIMGMRRGAFLYVAKRLEWGLKYAPIFLKSAVVLIMSDIVARNSGSGTAHADTDSGIMPA